MLTIERDQLAIFESFRVDFNLPKHKKARKAAPTSKEEMALALLTQTQAQAFDAEETESGPDEEGAVFGTNPVWSSGVVTVNAGGTFTVRSVLAEQAPRPWWAFWRRKQKDPDEGTISVEDFFLQLKGSAKEIAIVKERAEGYEAALRQAIATGQTALLERLKDNLFAYRVEAHLLSIGLSSYIEEADIVRFAKASKRGLKLDWIANFGRPIPSAIADKKVSADRLLAFDNYVVLHYDPKGTASMLTEAEKAAKRDPILFGVMKGVRKLYVIGDWIDEECDLTLDQIAESIGKGAIRPLGAIDPPTYRAI